MEVFFKLTAGALIAAVLGLLLSRKDKDIALLLTAAASGVILITAFLYLEPVLSFFTELQRLGNLDSDIMRVLIKSVGIGLLSEIASLICTDMGNAALGKTLQVAATILILWLSLPLLTSLLTLICDILEKV